MGTLHLSAIRLDEAMTVEQMITFQWRSTPTLIGARGRNPQGERVLVISAELPIQYVGIRCKADVELLHVERFRVDCRARSRLISVAWYCTDGQSATRGSCTRRTDGSLPHPGWAQPC